MPTRAGGIGGMMNVGEWSVAMNVAATHPNPNNAVRQLVICSVAAHRLMVSALAHLASVQQRTLKSEH
jgi:hypothetical protein